MSRRHDDGISNHSVNSSFEEINQQRRRLLQGGGAAMALSMAGVPMAMSFLPGVAQAAPPSSHGVAPITFANIEPSTDDTVRVPPGYVAGVLFAWGDPVSDGPAFLQDASNTAEEQMLQAGMHHDGMHYFPLPHGGRGRERASSARGLLAINHEYTDDGLLHSDGMDPWTAEKVLKSQAAHGVSIIEVALAEGRWQVVRPSPYARRITGVSEIGLGGPAAGSAMLATADDPAGRTVLGTLNNCAHGVTPWGTYLTCEENWNGYFAKTSGGLTELERRYGISGTGFGYRWHEHDERFDTAKHPNEPHRFGWVVEIDPYDPDSRPVKRTALGRFKHEGATTTLARDGRVVVYMGDDERFEYIYKFVSARRWHRSDKAANARILDEGTLYVARFDADGTGTWLPLVFGDNGLTPAAGFADQADVLVKTRLAADRVGATKMDRPEWIAVDPHNKDVYCTLTNNSQRGAAGKPGTNAANPRANNVFGHIIRWSERGGDPAALSFEWNIFVQCGDPDLGDAAKAGDIRGEARKFGSPDGLWFDPRGVLWIQTDVSTSSLNRGDYAGIGNNQMLAANPATGDIRRFLTGPRGCEITGVTATPDLRTLFINVQHPGEPASERSDPTHPKAVSSWPDGAAGGRPRSATVVIRKADGGVIGT
ncbi:MAG: PhoX family protein [Pseudomonadota bacterium]